MAEEKQILTEPEEKSKENDSKQSSIEESTFTLNTVLAAALNKQNLKKQKKVFLIY